MTCETCDGSGSDRFETISVSENVGEEAKGTDSFGESGRSVRARWGPPDQPLAPLEDTSAQAGTSLKQHVSFQFQFSNLRSTLTAP
jgi:hypothetical protein